MDGSVKSPRKSSDSSQLSLVTKLISYKVHEQRERVHAMLLGGLDAQKRDIHVVPHVTRYLYSAKDRLTSQYYMKNARSYKVHVQSYMVRAYTQILRVEIQLYTLAQFYMVHA